MKKYVLFGAGYFGKHALKVLGEDKVEFFVDNDGAKKNKYIDGKQVKIFEECKDELIDREVLICTTYYGVIIEQLLENNIKNYSIYKGLIERSKYYGTDELIQNPYINSSDRDLAEDEWMKKNDGLLKKKSINAKVEQYYQTNHLFHHIEIETINRCNGTCEFCPVNSLVDSREKKVMTEELFKKIIDELSEMNYSGRIALFSNNEPFLDKRIIEFHHYTRKKLPNARMHLFTNGTLLTLDKFIEITELLDELIIDNYNQELQLIKPCEEIKEYCEKHPELKKKVTIVLRKPKEILTSRGGDAPNRTKVNVDGEISCVNPFQQLIIRPDGKVSLCCNDPLGKITMGDVNDESIQDIWYGKRYTHIREAMRNGRGYVDRCKNCDVYVID